MSDYISLADLQAMSPPVLYHRWTEGLFPFDYARCNLCVAQHDWGSKWAGTCGHIQLRANASGMNFTGYDLRPHLERIYALRLFYRNLYPSNPPELDAIPNTSVTLTKEEVSV